MPAARDWRDKFDYIIHDTNGIKGVKGEEEFPLSETEYKSLNPEHRDTDCGECTFIQDADTLFLFFVPRDTKEKATEEPVFVGNFTMPNRTNHSGFYVFKCKNCGEVCVDYLHGYTCEVIYISVATSARNVL